jgi:hypothetical protein
VEACLECGQHLGRERLHSVEASELRAVLEVEREVAEGRALDRARAQPHLVARQRARLVAEDVLDLAEVLVDVRVAALRALAARRRVAHRVVAVDEDEAEDELDDLDRHEERVRDEVREEDPEGDEGEEEVAAGRRGVCAGVRAEAEVVAVNALRARARAGEVTPEL